MSIDPTLSRALADAVDCYCHSPLRLLTLPFARTHLCTQGLYYNRTAVQPKLDYECANGQAWLRKSFIFVSSMGNPPVHACPPPFPPTD